MVALTRDNQKQCSTDELSADIARPTLLEAALAYRGLGWSLMPVHALEQGEDGRWTCTCADGAGCTKPGKHVMGSWKGRQTTPLTEAQVEAHWTTGSDKGIAVVTGSVSGVVDVETDPRHGGDASWERLAEGHEDPVTWTSRSGGGGLHRFFKLPEGGQACRANPGGLLGIDVRGEGGLAILPPSRHHSGNLYEWLPGRAPGEVPLADLPDWLHAVIHRVPVTQDVNAELGGPLQRVEVDLLPVTGRIRDLILGVGGSGDRSKDQFAVVKALAEAGCDVNTIASAIWFNPDGIGEKAREQGEAWLLGDIHRILAKEGRDPRALPESARLPEGLGDDACPWLDEYVAWSRTWSPRSYDDFHEAVGLWVLSVVAARRLAAEMGGLMFPSLYVAFVAESGIFAKTTAVSLGVSLLRESGLRGLLAPDNVTPERLLAGMGGYLDDSDQPRQETDGDVLRASLDHLTGDATRELQFAFAAQRGWIHNELGGLIQGITSGQGYYKQYGSVLRELYDNPWDYEVQRMTREKNLIRAPYLCILGSMTPADLQDPRGRTHDTLFKNGLLARFALVCPSVGEPRSLARFPEGARTVPESLIQTLRGWHEGMAKPLYSVEQPTTSNGKARGRASLEITPVHPKRMAVSPEARDAYYHYHDAMGDLVDRDRGGLLNGSLTRFAPMALRVATLLAAVSGDRSVELRHWARAQEITERWRRGLYNLWDQLSSPAAREDRTQRLEERILQAHQRAEEPLSLRDATRNWRGVDRKDVVAAYETLVATGELVELPTGRTTRYAPPGVGGPEGSG